MFSLCPLVVKLHDNEKKKLVIEWRLRIVATLNSQPNFQEFELGFFLFCLNCS